MTSWGIQIDDPSKVTQDLIISARRDLSLKASLDMMLDSKLCGVNSRISNLEDRVTSVEQISPSKSPVFLSCKTNSLLLDNNDSFPVALVLSVIGKVLHSPHQCLHGTSR